MTYMCTKEAHILQYGRNFRLSNSTVAYSLRCTLRQVNGGRMKFVSKTEFRQSQKKTKTRFFFCSLLFCGFSIPERYHLLSEDGLLKCLSVVWLLKWRWVEWLQKLYYKKEGNQPLLESYGVNSGDEWKSETC